MLPVTSNILLHNREEAGYLLSKRLAAFRNSNAVVVGVPKGGVCVASVIAMQLGLPLQVMPCRRIKHPGHSSKYIGSVSEDEVYIQDCSRTIPQDYIQHQIALARNSIAHEAEVYSSVHCPARLRYRPVIVVDDVLSGSDTLMACLRSIRKQNPLKLVVAVAVTSPEALQMIRSQVDDVQYLTTAVFPSHARDYFVEYPPIDEGKVKELLHTVRETVGRV